jgi:elongation factor 1 alpha-like protein
LTGRYTNISSEPANLARLFGLLDKASGKVIKKFPRAIPANSSAEIELTTKRPICLELFRNFKEFGRFSLRAGDKTIAVGIVTKLYRS